MDRLYRVLFDTSFRAELAALGFERIGQHLDRVQERRNAFAHGEPTRNLRRLSHDSGREQYYGQREFICAVVLQAPLPFHMVRDIREVIEAVAVEMEPAWTSIRERIHFVPMSVRELEISVAIELHCGVSIEDQLIEYAKYREQVKRIDRWDNGHPIFPMHLEDFVQERYNAGNRIVNPLCTEKWKSFTAFCQQRIFGEDISVVEQEIFEITQRRAYELWEQRGRPLWDDQQDWLEAERQLAEDPNFVGG